MEENRAYSKVKVPVNRRNLELHFTGQNLPEMRTF